MHRGLYLLVNFIFIRNMIQIYIKNVISVALFVIKKKK